MFAWRNVPPSVLPGSNLFLFVAAVLIPLVLSGCGASSEPDGGEAMPDPISSDLSAPSALGPMSSDRAIDETSLAQADGELASTEETPAAEGAEDSEGGPREALSDPADLSQEAVAPGVDESPDTGAGLPDLTLESEPSESGGTVVGGLLEPATVEDDASVGLKIGPEDAVSADEEPLEPVVIPTGTRIPTVMGLTLSTRTHQVGDTFQVTVSEEILASDGMVLVPEGARLEGRIADARRSSDPEEEALLSLAFESLLIDGTIIPLDAVVAEAEVETASAASDTRTAITVVTGAAAGAVLGRILGGDARSAIQGAAVGALGGAGVAFTTRDGHAVIREGTRLVVLLETPAKLAPLIP